MKILANDGISKSGVDALQNEGFEVITTKVAQVQLENFINEHQIDAIRLYFTYFLLFKSNYFI